jgi:hypothetical protein
MITHFDSALAWGAACHKAGFVVVPAYPMSSNSECLWPAQAFRPPTPDGEQEFMGEFDHESNTGVIWSDYGAYAEWATDGL